MDHTRVEKILKKYLNFTLFTPKLPPLGVGVKKFIIYVSLPYIFYILNLVKISPVVLENMLTHGGRRTMTSPTHKSSE